MNRSLSAHFSLVVFLMGAVEVSCITDLLVFEGTDGTSAFVKRIIVGLTSFFLMMCLFALAAIPIELDARHSIANSRSPEYVVDEGRVPHTGWTISLSIHTWWEC